MKQLEWYHTLSDREVIALCPARPFFAGDIAIAIRTEPGHIIEGETVTVTSCYRSIMDRWVVVTNKGRYPYASNLRKLSSRSSSA